jgi:ADP-heptose:LPS heptosyltransferase
MSAPAISALKSAFDAKITLLTSSMAKPVTSLLSDVAEVIIFDLPWVKKETSSDQEITSIIQQLKERHFDAAVIFTVFSQNPLPAAMLAYMAGIPKVLAYCRENPYDLITDWIPDEEPYSFMRHQVRRDLDLVATIGAVTNQDEISINVSVELTESVSEKLQALGVQIVRPWLVLHPGVSEEKRKYPQEDWVRLGKKLASDGYQLLITGSDKEKDIAESLSSAIGEGAYSLAGICNFGEFTALIKMAPLVVSVNTATIHIASATKTSVIVLYALSNPQHLPWKARGAYFPFNIPETLRSRNEVLKYVCDKMDLFPVHSFAPDDVYNAAIKILQEPNTAELFPELVEISK